MGYYTDYDISKNDMTVQQAIEEKSGYTGWYSGQLNVKWYDHHRDCLEVSKDFPNCVIELSGLGEDSDDVPWKNFYKNGKCQEVKAVITFAEYDEEKLK